VPRAYPLGFTHVPQEYPRQCGSAPYAHWHLPTITPKPLYNEQSSIFLTLTPMSHTHPTASSSSNFQLMINNALDTYKKRTKKDLLTHPLAARLQTCNSSDAIIAILQEQAQGVDQSQSGDERWSKWLDPTVNVLQAFSSVLEAGASMVCFMTFFRVLYPYIYVTGIPTCECNLCRRQCPPFSEYP
jgi:hypothetical protein